VNPQDASQAQESPSAATGRSEGVPAPGDEIPGTFKAENELFSSRRVAAILTRLAAARTAGLADLARAAGSGGG
jgi:hypothetical protein